MPINGIPTGFDYLGGFVNAPAASAGDLPNLLALTSNQTPVLNSFTPVYPPLITDIFGGGPPGIGSALRPFPNALTLPSLNAGFGNGTNGGVNPGNGGTNIFGPQATPTIGLPTTGGTTTTGGTGTTGTGITGTGAMTGTLTNSALGDTQSFNAILNPSTSMSFDNGAASASPFTLSNSTNFATSAPMGMDASANTGVNGGDMGAGMNSAMPDISGGASSCGFGGAGDPGAGAMADAGAGNADFSMAA